MSQQKVVFAGAGASAQGISGLIVAAMMDDGLSRADAIGRVYTVDSRGLVTQDRTDLEEFKATYAKSVEEIESWQTRDRSHITLEEVVSNAEPTILLGTSGSPGAFSEAVVRAMARVNINERPIIFPLSNPTSKSECTPENAIRWSDGRAIVATGSPFDPVSYGDHRFRIGQGNNAFIFPGIGLGLTVSRARRVTDTMFLEAARALASQVNQDDLDQDAVYPELTRIRECSHAVACATVRQAVSEGFADKEILDHLEERIQQAMWFPEYLPFRYEGGPVLYRDV